MLELPDHAYAAHLPSRMALHDDLSPDLWAFLASITIEGLMVTGLWVGCLAKHW